MLFSLCSVYNKFPQSEREKKLFSLQGKENARQVNEILDVDSSILVVKFRCFIGIPVIFQDFINLV